MARDRALCLAPPDDLALAGVPAAPWRHPLSGAPAALVPAADASRASALGPTLDPASRAVAEAHAALRRSAHLLVGVQEVQALLDAQESTAPALVREVARQLPPAVIADVLRRLLEEQVTIRPLRPILETLVAASPGSSPPALCDACRRALARHIAQPLLRGDALEALLLDPAAERLLSAWRAWAFPYGEEPARRIRAVEWEERGQIRASLKARWMPFTARQRTEASID